MRRNAPSVRLCLLTLALALCWRIVGAPISREDFRHVQTGFWQARTLLPQRMLRIGRCWIGHLSLPARPVHEETEELDDPLTLSVYITQENRLAIMELDEYVRGVVAAEMPAQNHLEALKAQAVAARTRALKQITEGGCADHPGADICTDSSHCQGWLSQDECHALWNDSFDAYWGRVTAAVSACRRQALTYEGELITVLYHAMSGGRTEDAQTVFSMAVPYLVSVESAGEEDTRGFWQEAAFSFEEIAKRLNAAFPQAHLSAQEVRRTLSIGGYTDSGRVSTMRVGSLEMSGPAFRQALGLRSTWFSISSDDEGVTFAQRGYGHGVGMSQVGANVMAANGADYTEILAHYYPGTALEKR